jgi:hypothetical protein
MASKKVGFAALAAFTFAGFGTARAGDISGHYKMDGTDTTGIAYDGTADIAMASESSCRITFSDGWEGICMLKGTSLAVAYIVHGKVGLAVYEISSDGSMKGIFVDDYHGGGIGNEKLTPIR